MATTLEKRWDALGERVGRNLDVPLVLALMGVLFTILVPLPPLLLDLLLVVNFTLSLLILLGAIYAAHPLELSAFPSVLLMTTFFRLALNIATTRLILSRAGEEGTRAAGRVVEVFGGFVAGSSPLVGFVIFTIIVVVQFVVITKGAGRVSEVAARFTLDAMPGKQLSIDADLNAGLIDQEEARQRRRRIGREADFYGAMDGASKFIRGDAIAGIIILLVNILGGLILGYLHYGMSPGEAAQLFTRLTIGDGLVTQVPALLVSLSAGLLITRSAAEGSLGRDVLAQMAGSPRALYIAAGFLLVLLPTGLPPALLLLGAAACGGLGLLRSRGDAVSRGRDAGPAAPASSSGREAGPSRGLPGVDLLEIEIGYGLIHLVDEGRRGNLLERIQGVREKLGRELGLRVPPVRVRDNLELGPEEYVIKIRGAPAGRGAARPARSPDLGADDPAGGETRELEGAIQDHLTRVIQERAAELLTREETASLVEGLKERAPALVREVVPEVLKPGEIQKVLQNLLRERVSIRDLEAILETLADHAPRTREPEVLTEEVRRALGRSLCEAHRAADGKIHAVSLDPALEDLVASSAGVQGSGLTLSPETAGGIVERIRARLDPLGAQGFEPLLICGREARPHLRKLLEEEVPRAAVLSYEEIVKDVPVEFHGTVEK